MITLSELSALFCKDLPLARVARALLGSTDLLTANELASSGAFSLDLASLSLEALSDLGLAQMDPGLSGGFTYKIRPESRPIVEQAVSAMEDDFISRRAAEWKIDAKGRLEWIEGMYQMIQHGKKSYHANLR